MLCFVLALTLTTVGARELKFLTALDDKEAMGALTIKDPWSPIIGDTEGAPSVTPRLRSWSSPLRRGQASTSPSGRRANNLVENLRRQLMRDNYDYLSKDSAENSSTTISTTVSTTTSPPTTRTKTTTTKTTKVTMLNEEAANALEAKYVSSPYFNPVLTTLEAGDFVARAHSEMQVASVNLPKFPMSAVSTSTTSWVTARSSKVLLANIATRSSVPRRPSAAAQLPAVGSQSPAAYPPSAIHSPAADHSSIPGYHAPAYKPVAVHHPTAGYPPAALPASPLQPSGGGFNQFRSFDEAYNTPSPILDQHGTEPKREVFKKDLLYYVDDDKLKPGLHLRRNNDLSSDVNQAQDREDHYGDSASLLSAQSGQDMTTVFDTSQQKTYGQQLRRDHRRDAIYQRLRGNVRHSYKKSKRREKIKPGPVDGIKRRARLYGLRPKQYGSSRHVKSGSHKKHSRNYKQRYDEYSRRHERVAYKREHPYDTPTNGRHNNKVIYRRNSHIGPENNNNQEYERDSQKGTTNSKKSNIHVTKYDKQYDDQETTIQIDENIDKKQTNSSTDENKNLNEIKEEPQGTQDTNNENINDMSGDKKDFYEGEKDLNEDKQDINEENVDTVHNIDHQHEVGQPEDAKDDQSNDAHHYSPYMEETTSNVKYKLLKVHSLGGSRRSGSGSAHHIIQERGSQGVALISLDQAPFPQFQLPRARRQYMQESGNARHPLMEQLPKPISRRSYEGHHHSSQ